MSGGTGATQLGGPGSGMVEAPGGGYQSGQVMAPGSANGAQQIGGPGPGMVEAPGGGYQPNSFLNEYNKGAEKLGASTGKGGSTSDDLDALLNALIHALAGGSLFTFDSGKKK